jgi:hypothetical protein
VGSNPKPNSAFQNPGVLLAKSQVFPAPSVPLVLQTMFAGSLKPAVVDDDPLVMFAPEMLMIC